MMEAPTKLYYSISEVSSQTGVKAYVLRYWETQFSMLRPRKSRGGVRKYRPKDLALVERIRHLLYDRGYTIAGARRKILDERKENRTDSGSQSASTDKPSPIESLAAPKTAAPSSGPGADSIASTKAATRKAKKAKDLVLPAAKVLEIRQELVQLRKLLAKY